MIKVINENYLLFSVSKVEDLGDSVLLKNGIKLRITLDLLKYNNSDSAISLYNMIAAKRQELSKLEINITTDYTTLEEDITKQISDLMDKVGMIKLRGRFVRLEETISEDEFLGFLVEFNNHSNWIKENLSALMVKEKPAEMTIMYNSDNGKIKSDYYTRVREVLGNTTVTIAELELSQFKLFRPVPVNDDYYIIFVGVTNEGHLFSLVRKDAYNAQD